MKSALNILIKSAMVLLTIEGPTNLYVSEVVAVHVEIATEEVRIRIITGIWMMVVTLELHGINVTS